MFNETIDQAKAAIFSAITKVFTLADEPLMPVIVTYQGRDGATKIVCIDPEIVQNPVFMFEYCNQFISLEQALSNFVLGYLGEHKQGYQNGNEYEGKMEFDANYRTVTLFHSKFKMVLTEEDPEIV